MDKIIFDMAELMSRWVAPLHSQLAIWDCALFSARLSDEKESIRIDPSFFSDTFIISYLKNHDDRTGWKHRQSGFEVSNLSFTTFAPAYYQYALLSDAEC